MRKFVRDISTPQFVPDYMAASLLAIDFHELKKAGVKYIAFDADSTLVHFRGRILDKKTKLFLHDQRPLFRSWVIASNRITNDLLPLAESMDAQVIRATLLNRKPQRRFFDQVINHFGAQPHEVAMIGDKLLADIWGGKRAGMVTVWVEKIGPDSPWDQVTRLRYWEKRLLRKFL
jgi:HAD superfamily phosphatase (TIGR01668 family)